LDVRYLFTALCALSASAAHAQSASPQTAPSPWSLHKGLGAPDDLKLSATFRVRYDTIDGQARPGFNASDDTVNLRTTLFAEYHTGPLRIGAEIYDSRAYFADSRTPITTNEVNAAEFVQAYAAIDLDKPFGTGSHATIQAGRFVLNLGSRRLVAADDYRNTTNGYTGLRGDVKLRGGIKATAIYVLPTTRLPDDLAALLDNAFAPDRESFDAVLWGGLASKGQIVGKASAELSFYHFSERDRAGRPTRDRSLNTMGLRVFREPAAGKIDFEIEGFYQWGHISSSAAANAATLDVSATFLHADIGYSFVAPWKPRISLRFDRASGDENGPTFSRFDTLYGMRRAEIAPSGLYNSVGRANLLSPAIRLEVAPSKRSELFVHYRPLWLASRTDSFSTSSVRDATGRSGNFAGHQFEARWRQWLVIDALRFEGNIIYLAKGRFLTSAPNAPATGNTSYASLNLTAFF
jgi:hypothetical protein